MSGARITCKSNSSIRIEGEFKLYDLEGNEFDLGERTHVSLCRCGASEDKPFCDGMHKKAGFQSEIKARPVPVRSKKP